MSQHRITDYKGRIQPTLAKFCITRCQLQTNDMPCIYAARRPFIQSCPHREKYSSSLNSGDQMHFQSSYICCCNFTPADRGCPMFIERMCCEWKPLPLTMCTPSVHESGVQAMLVNNGSHLYMHKVSRPSCSICTNQRQIGSYPQPCNMYNNLV